MLYDFIDDATGETVTLPYDANLVPRIGDEIKHDGRTLRRVFCGDIASAEIARMTWGFPRASNALPKNLPGCKVDKKGRPIITSRKHERELTARHGLVPQNLDD